MDSERQITKTATLREILNEKLKEKEKKTCKSKTDVREEVPAISHNCDCATKIDKLKQKYTQVKERKNELKQKVNNLENELENVRKLNLELQEKLLHQGNVKNHIQ